MMYNMHISLQVHPIRSKLIPREESILEQSASENTSLTRDHQLATVYKVNFG